ncbi:MAG: MarR family transcriptional regulator [Gemmatimonadaceae bacterium]|nr:MarR family transcriptional regulator [Gemmatimonadaceae bacterium]
MDPALSTFIEQLGVISEADGLPRGAGRVFGLLLTRPEPTSLEELADLLAVSKAAVSVNARMLEHRGVIELVTRPGDRRDYYRVAPDLPRRTMQGRIARMQRFRDAIAMARKLRPTDAAVAARLDDLDDAYAFLSEVITRALADWCDGRRPARKRARRVRA